MVPMTQKHDKQAKQRLDRWLERMLASYIGDDDKADRTQVDARIELGDLAMFDPPTFWEFVEYVATSAVPADQLTGLGHGGLFWLLRNHPDSYDKRLAGLVRRDERFRVLVREIDPDRIAPDVWRQIEAALASG